MYVPQLPSHLKTFHYGGRIFPWAADVLSIDRLVTTGYIITIGYLLGIEVQMDNKTIDYRGSAEV